MDRKIYEKTRYQNIYRHKKNKNYVIMMSKPVKTSISRIDGKKIIDIDSAVKIRDNYVIRNQKGIESVHKESFDILWEKYINSCRNIKKLSYNTIVRKQKDYNKYLKEKIDKPVSKITKDYMAEFIDNCNCSNKQKNQLLKTTKAFFNWCIYEEFVINNPIQKIEKYKVEKYEMKYWLPNEIKSFMDTVNEDIHSNDINIKKRAMITKTIVIIGLAIGDRIGETRALRFTDFSEKDNTINISHSINYDRLDKNFVKDTKTPQSIRKINIDKKLLEHIDNYRKFLVEECNLKVSDDSLLFFNYSTQKPYSDVALRKKFYYYCDKANVTKIRMYDLRHTFTTMMMSEEVPLYILSSILGHSNYNTTVKEYGHITNDVKKKIADIASKYY